jgi:hypothetical protein
MPELRDLLVRPPRLEDRHEIRAERKNMIARQRQARIGVLRKLLLVNELPVARIEDLQQTRILDRIEQPLENQRRISHAPSDISVVVGVNLPDLLARPVRSDAHRPQRRRVLIGLKMNVKKCHAIFDNHSRPPVDRLPVGVALETSAEQPALDDLASFRIE